MTYGDTEVDDFLEHFGVPGMKWGRRRESRLQSITRVGNGEGSVRDTARALTREISAHDLRRYGGVKNAAKQKAIEMEDRKKRTVEGKRIVGDILSDIGLVALSNVGSKRK